MGEREGEKEDGGGVGKSVERPQENPEKKSSIKLMLSGTSTILNGSSVEQLTNQAHYTPLSRKIEFLF